MAGGEVFRGRAAHEMRTTRRPQSPARQSDVRSATFDTMSDRPAGFGAQEPTGQVPAVPVRSKRHRPENPAAARSQLARLHDG